MPASPKNTTIARPSRTMSWSVRRPMFTELGTRHRSDLVDHQAACLPQAVVVVGIYREPDEWCLGRIGGERAHRYRIRAIESIVLKRSVVCGGDAGPPGPERANPLLPPRTSGNERGLEATPQRRRGITHSEVPDGTWDRIEFRSVAITPLTTGRREKSSAGSSPDALGVTALASVSGRQCHLLLAGVAAMARSFHRTGAYFVGTGHMFPFRCSVLPRTRASETSF